MDAQELHDGWPLILHYFGDAGQRRSGPGTSIVAQTLRCAAQSSAIPCTGLEDESVARGRPGAAAHRARAASRGNALCRQADHRRGRRPGPGAASDVRRAAVDRQRIAGPHRFIARARIRPGGGLRRAGPRRLAAGFAAVGTVQQRDQPPAHGARGRARPRGFRGQRASGPAGTRAATGQWSLQPHRATLRPGAGRGDRRKLRGGPAHLCAVAHRSARHRAPAGVHRRGAFQCAKLLAQLYAHAGAARTRLRPANRGQRRDRQGSEDLRPERVPDRALSRARHELLRGQSAHRAASCGLGQPALRHRDGGLLRRVRLHRVAHAPRRFLHWRPHISRGLVPAPAHAAGKPASRVLAGRGAGTVLGRPVLVLRNHTGDRAAAQPAPVSRSHRGGLPVRERRLPLPRRRALGRARPDLRTACGRNARVSGRKRRRQDDAGQAAGTTLRSGRGTHPARRARPARVRPVRAARQYRRHLPGLRPLPLHRGRQHCGRAHRGARRPRAYRQRRGAQPGGRGHPQAAQWLRPGPRQALPDRRRSFRRRMAEGGHRARVHARRAAADPGRADRGARRTLGVRGFQALQGFERRPDRSAHLAPLFERADGRPDRGSQGWRGGFRGTHAELLALRGRYAELFELQAAGYR